VLQSSDKPETRNSARCEFQVRHAQPSTRPKTRRIAVIDKPRAAETSGEMHHGSDALRPAYKAVNPGLLTQTSC
jgi:hypothetical protein